MVYTRPIFSGGKVIRPDDLTMWGTPKANVPEGHCTECEGREGNHYRTCTQRPQITGKRNRKGCPECHSPGAHKLNCSRRNKRQNRKDKA